VPPSEVVAELRALGAGKRALLGALHMDDLSVDDLADIAWSGDPRHLVTVRLTLERARGGEVEYLCARAPSGAPVGKLCIECGRFADAGYLSQFATHPRLQGRGIGTFVMAGAEQRIRRRGRVRARISVEAANPRAQALYERLGFEVVGHGVERWDRDDAPTAQSADVVLLCKELEPS